MWLRCTTLWSPTPRRGPSWVTCRADPFANGSARPGPCRCRGRAGVARGGGGGWEGGGRGGGCGRLKPVLNGLLRRNPAARLDPQTLERMLRAIARSASFTPGVAKNLLPVGVSKAGLAAIGGVKPTLAEPVEAVPANAGPANAGPAHAGPAK